jgi:diadenosine tetraphosphatase ApaH/serine/threonine PP2A family protein phosphatase
MIFGIVSDIHGNLVALKAVLEDALSVAVDRWICLGDTVGYGADPAECVAWVREHCDIVLMGNHDAAIAGIIDPEQFMNEDAVVAVRKHREALRKDDLDWLSKLPLTWRLDEPEMYLVHGAPTQNPYLDYLVWDVSPDEAFAATTESIIGVGHTHIPHLYGMSPEGGIFPVVAFGARPPADPIPLRPGSRFLFNPGSVGQPRDRDPRASYALLDTTARTLTFRRVSYDIIEAQRRMRMCGYPQWLWERLQYGR